jgi:hypothetical protein
MDFINKGKAALSGNNNAQQGGQAPAQGQTTQGGAGQEDYGDKGMSSVERSETLDSSIARGLLSFI